MINNLLSIFPLSIYRSRLNLELGYKNKLLEYILEEESMYKNESAFSWTGDNYGNEYLHNNKEFELLYVEITKHIKSYCQDIGLNNEFFDINFQRSWATVSRNDQFIKEHTHSQSNVSFAYYLKFPAGAGGLYFIDKIRRNEIIADFFLDKQFSRKMVIPNQLNANILTIHPEEDMIVIFPSKEWHGTRKGTNKEPRISMSSDVVITLKDEIAHSENGIPSINKWKIF